MLQIVAAIMAITGIVMMAYADGFHGDSFVGVALAVGSASTSALYKVSLSGSFFAVHHMINGNVLCVDLLAAYYNQSDFGLRSPLVFLVLAQALCCLPPQVPL